VAVLADPDPVSALSERKTAAPRAGGALC
jgi:hypothetical protein